MSNMMGDSFDFVINTNETYIKPNEQFISFVDQLNSKTIIEDIISDSCNGGGGGDGHSGSASAGGGSSQATAAAAKSGDKFVDFSVKQYKSDGFVCTLDENDRQIYYCYFCHQYISDFDLIATHIDTAQHLKNILNGISYDRGLDKDFVIDAEDKPKHLARSLDKVLTRMPVHLKHYYFRNGVRLLMVKPPNACFCKFCNQTIPHLKEIESHLASESHKFSQRKQRPDLMQLIDKSDDPLLRIGLQFISEDIISDKIVVYECELCNCFDCDYEKMFDHMKSFKHRKNILKEYNYDTEDINEVEMETNLKDIEEKHGVSSIKTNDKVNGTDTDGKDNADPNKSSPTPQIPLFEVPDSGDAGVVGGVSGQEIAVIDGAFIREDTLVSEYESHYIIQTFESDARDIYFCCYCDRYYNTFKLMRHHVQYDAIHAQLRAKGCNCSQPLNEKFVMRGLPAESDEKMREIEILNAIPLVIKHFYYKRGVKYTGNNSYYCRYCQKPINNFDSIDEHLKSESHRRIEEKPTKFNDILFQTNQPIIGLKYITEYFGQNAKQVLYECTLCDYFTDFFQMFVHLSSFVHQYRVLRKISPNNDIFNQFKETEISFKSSDLLKQQITRIEKRIGSGFLKRSYFFDSTIADKLANIDETDKTRRETKIKKLEGDEAKDEAKDHDILVQQLTESFAVKLANDDEVEILVAIIESLKDSLIAYYSKNAIK